MVLHLVDWNGDRSRPAKLQLRTASFFGDHPLEISLRVPKTYEASAHAAAEQSARSQRQPGDRLGGRQADAYEPLVRETSLAALPAGEFTIVEVPPLDPWGLLVIRAKK